MPTLNAIVVRTYAGRAGLFTATLAPLDGGALVDVHVSDLDGEPERFNERLTMTRLLRDAMDHAEPVIAEYQKLKTGQNELESVRRCTRHHVGIGSSNQDFTGVVVQLAIREQNQATAISEHSDVAEILLVDPTSRAQRQLFLAFQRAERAVATAMLDVLTSAHETGDPVTVRVASTDRQEFFPSEWIIGVERSRFRADTSSTKLHEGFVEAISSDVVSGAPFAYVELTTAPPFIGEGNVVDPSYFEPETILLVVSKRSHMMELLTQALNDGQRVAVGALAPTKEPPRENGGKKDAPAAVAYADLKQESFQDAQLLERTKARGEVKLALSVSLLAPLASQARPVWVRVHREALDRPPEGDCAGPVPTSELSPAHVASLQVPHRAAWEGAGCFNRGVYRIQIVSPVQVRVFVDGKEKSCVFSTPFTFEPTVDDSAPAAEQPAHRILEVVATAPTRVKHRPQLLVYSVYICLEGCHTVRVEVDEWRCGNRFDLDVMKIR